VKRTDLVVSVVPCQNSVPAGRWATVMRAMERNVPRTRSVGCSSRGAQNPHRPHTREPSAPAAARPAPPQIEATEIRATRSRLLDVALAVVDTVERSAPCRKTADGNSLAPAELSRFLDQARTKARGHGHTASPESLPISDAGALHGPSATSRYRLRKLVEAAGIEETQTGCANQSRRAPGPRA